MSDTTVDALREPPFPVFMHAMFGGVTFWSIHLVVSTALVGPACAHGISWVINLITVITAAITAVAIVASVIVYRYADTSANPGRTRLLGEIGGVFSTASFLLILLEGYPVLVLDACAR